MRAARRKNRRSLRPTSSSRTGLSPFTDGGEAEGGGEGFDSEAVPCGVWLGGLGGNVFTSDVQCGSSTPIREGLRIAREEWMQRRRDREARLLKGARALEEHAHEGAPAHQRVMRMVTPKARCSAKLDRRWPPQGACDDGWLVRRRVPHV